MKTKTTNHQPDDLNLFQILEALDKKDYGYYDRLTAEQQKKFVPYMMLMWMSCVKANSSISRYYAMSVNEYANKHLFNEYIQKHPKLQWLMLCSSSPGIGKQFHQWIPHINSSVSKLKTAPKEKDVREYFKKIYASLDNDELNEITNTWVTEQKRKLYLAELFPTLKLSDIETLNSIITDDDIKDYERNRGN